MRLSDPLQLVSLDRLDHLSRELAGAAGELSRVRAGLQARAAALPWHSSASRAFQAVLQELLGQLGQSGSRLVELSAALACHRRRAADRAAALGRLGHRSLDLLERAVRLP